ncbi:MAG: GNAT family N-acetyltransferase [Gammaproteobacteria bacterium]|nr:GNAT family N-acetyltransferase [Gammaproteobacteria bacterium]
MKFVTYSNWEQLPTSANTLFQQAEKNSVFLSRPWFESLIKFGLDDEHTLLLACVINGDRVLAILPLMKANDKAWYSLKHGYTPISSLLLADDDQESILACLGEGLAQSPITGLLLEPVAGDDELLLGLQKVLEAYGFHCEYRFRDYNWIYRLNGQSYAEYLASRPGKLRSTISRKGRKLEREHGYEIRLYRDADVAPAMSDYYKVVDASWKQNELDNAEFMADFVEAFTTAGWSRLAILYVEGEPIAAQLWFVHHGKASIYRLSYAKEWRSYSPGSILTAYLMEYVIDTDKVEEIDFLTGNDAYKQDWMSERRERVVLSCIRQLKPLSWYEKIIKHLKYLQIRQ